MGTALRRMVSRVVLKPLRTSTSPDAAYATAPREYPGAKRARSIGARPVYFNF
jgi:hypothetical protein